MQLVLELQVPFGIRAPIETLVFGFSHIEARAKSSIARTVTAHELRPS